MTNGDTEESSPMRGYSFTVTRVSQGSFPLAMLSHDHCWPKFESEVSLISRSFKERHPGEQIHLEGLRRPSLGRWKSAGWQVDELHRETWPA